MNDMSIGQFMASILADVWSLFSTPHPVLGISFGAILIGVIVVKVAIGLLSPLFGLGSSATHTVYKSAEKGGNAWKR